MQINLQNVGRDFGNQIVIKGLDFQFEEGKTYALLGGNGSGKSTLIKLVYGALSLSYGKINHRQGNTMLAADEVPFKVSLAGPYLELIEELTAEEFLAFYTRFRPLKKGITIAQFLNICYLSPAAQKEIRNYSSGMKQRLRLGLAFLSKSDLVLLDEPTSNLDPEGVEWFKKLWATHLENRTLLVGSNFDPNEIEKCEHQLSANEWRKA